jgi:hypothetical protein
VAIKPDTLLADVMSRLLYLRQLRAAALEAFERVTDNRERVRTSDVGKHVADKMGRNVSGHFQRDIEDALVNVGWRKVMTGGVPFWKGVKRR